jgi:glucose-6-phosphate isomerase
MNFNCGFDIKPEYNPLGFTYGKEVFGPEVENRRLDDIRKSLLDPNCEGPEIVYSIAMDVGKLKDKAAMIEKNLLYGAVTYASGQLGKEPIRSQGHIHAVSKSCNASTPEVYEIWSGEAIIYMQESAKDNPGRCFAVKALPGEVVIVPPGWAHSTISSNPKVPLTFGAWCVRDFGFDYKDVREHKGLAYFPILDKDEGIYWIKNENYEVNELIVKTPRDYKEFSIESGKSIYTQFEENPEKFLFVANPNITKDLWCNFIP